MALHTVRHILLVLYDWFILWLSAELLNVLTNNTETNEKALREKQTLHARRSPLIDAQSP